MSVLTSNENSYRVSRFEQAVGQNTQLYREPFSATPQLINRILVLPLAASTDSSLSVGQYQQTLCAVDIGLSSTIV